MPINPNSLIWNRQAVWMEGRNLCAIDQRVLPHTWSILKLEAYPQSVEAIRNMAVRGAGTIGATGAFAMAQAAVAASEDSFWSQVAHAAQEIARARPTAKNLSYAVGRVYAAIGSTGDIPSARQRAVAQAQGLYEKDVQMTRAIAQAGVALLPREKAVLTHCNAGWLAYPGWGTALAPLFLAHENGQSVFVYATETRPRSQGAKLTVWELSEAGIPCTLIADTAAGAMMKKGNIGLVIVGADRIAANGDTANKIGTYTLAILAREHGIPFYVAAPSPTFDVRCPSGEQIPIEERDEWEVLEISGRTPSGQAATVQISPEGVHATNPAFDVTPARLITGFLTESGVVEPTPEMITHFLKQSEVSIRNGSASTAV